MQVVWGALMTARVLIVSPFPPPYGGIANYAANLVRGLRDCGIHVDCYDSGRYDRFRFRAPGDDRGYWRALDPRNALFLLVILFEWIPYSLTILRRRATVVHVHTASSWAWWRSMVHIALGRLFRCRTILHIHNAIDFFYQEESGRLGQWLIRKSLRLPNRIITLSEGIRSFLQEITAGRITVVYNGVNTSLFQNEKLYCPPFRMLFAGAVGRQKGVADLLQAVKRSGLGPEQLKVTIVGKESTREMRRFAGELNLADQIVFAGRVSDEIKLELFRTHHIFALPSYAEGQPISILEGMAAGMAILSTNVGSIPEIVKHGENGFLVNPGDIDDMAKRILDLTEPKSLQRMGQHNSQQARDSYEFRRVVRDVANVYAQMVNEASGASIGPLDTDAGNTSGRANLGGQRETPS